MIWETVKAVTPTGVKTATGFKRAIGNKRFKVGDRVLTANGFVMGHEPYRNNTISISEQKGFVVIAENEALLINNKYKIIDKVILNPDSPICKKIFIKTSLYEPSEFVEYDSIWGYDKNNLILYDCQFAYFYKKGKLVNRINIKWAYHNTLIDFGIYKKEKVLCFAAVDTKAWDEELIFNMSEYRNNEIIKKTKNLSEIIQKKYADIDKRFSSCNYHSGASYYWGSQNLEFIGTTGFTPNICAGEENVYCGLHGGVVTKNMDSFSYFVFGRIENNYYIDQSFFYSNGTVIVPFSPPIIKKFIGATLIFDDFQNAKFNSMDTALVALSEAYEQCSSFLLEGDGFSIRCDISQSSPYVFSCIDGNIMQVNNNDKLLYLVGGNDDLKVINQKDQNLKGLSSLINISGYNAPRYFEMITKSEFKRLFIPFKEEK